MPSPAKRPASEKKDLPRAEHAYQYLCNAIRSGALVPGMRLRETELAEAIGLSRTPVREALGRLENEGLVVNKAGHGLVITEFDYNMISEFYAIREVLEGTAARLAARHASDVEIALLRDIANQDPQELDANDAWGKNNKRFHEVLYHAAHNRYLLKTLRPLNQGMVLLGKTSLLAPGRAAAAAAEHGALVSALEARDADKADRLMREHIRAAYKIRLLTQASDKEETR